MSEFKMYTRPSDYPDIPAMEALRKYISSLPASHRAACFMVEYQYDAKGQCLSNYRSIPFTEIEHRGGVVFWFSELTVLWTDSVKAFDDMGMYHDKPRVQWSTEETELYDSYFAKWQKYTVSLNDVRNLTNTTT